MCCIWFSVKHDSYLFLCSYTSETNYILLHPAYGIPRDRQTHTHIHAHTRTESETCSGELTLLTTTRQIRSCPMSDLWLCLYQSRSNHTASSCYTPSPPSPPPSLSSSSPPPPPPPSTTRKHRQSYRHADPRRQQQHTAVAARVTSNRATVTVFVTVWLWPFDLWVNACWANTTE